MQQIDSALLLKYLGGVERAMDEAGGGKYRAINLVTELARVGIGLTAIEMPPEEPETPERAAGMAAE